MADIKLYDTLNNKSFTINRSNPSIIKMYVCGPTVYDYAHVGHLKTYMNYDIIRRVFEHLGVGVQFMMNITNVDDKIIKRTYQTEYSLSDDFDMDLLRQDQYLPAEKFVQFADKWESHFFEVMDKMNISRPNIVSRVTEYIPEMLDFVEEIEKRGFTFEDDGSVYFYGTKYDDVKTDDGTYSKDSEHKLNFALLKKAQSYEPGWSSKWGLIRPGWSLECSVMASDVFGDHVDMHGGAVDLKFLHQHNEFLQSNARFGFNLNGDTNNTNNNTNNTDNNADTNKKWVEQFMHTVTLISMD